MSILREETGLSQMHTAEVIVTNRRDKHMNEQFVNKPNEKPRHSNRGQQLTVRAQCAATSRPKRTICRVHGDRSAPRIGNGAQFQARSRACRSYHATRRRPRSRSATRSGLGAARRADRFLHFAHYSRRGKGWPARLWTPDSSETGKQFRAV